MSREEEIDESHVRRSAFQKTLEGMPLIEAQIRKEAFNTLERLLEENNRTGRYIDSDRRKGVVAEVYGWPLESVVRYEYGSPDGQFGGTFYLLKDDRAKAMSFDHDFWVECVLPQQYAFTRIDLLDLVGGLPSHAWRVGRP